MAERNENYAKLQEIIAKHKGEKGALMPVMQEAQSLFGYLPMDVQQIIADGLGTTLSEVYGVATFYSQFTLYPQGKYVISICLGTACYVKGAQKVLDEVCKELGIDVGQTSADGLFTIEATRCLGACGLAPVMTVNGEVYGRLVPEDVPTILAKYKNA